MTLTPLGEGEKEEDCLVARAQGMSLLASLLEEKAAIDTVWQFLKDMHSTDFFHLLLQCLESDEIELQDAALYCLTHLAQSMSQKKHADKTNDDTCSEFYDNLKSPYWEGPQNRGDGDSVRSNDCQPEYLAEEMFKSLIVLYQKLSTENKTYESSEDERWVRVCSCMASVLSVSGRSRTYAVHRRLPEMLLATLQAVRDHLTMLGKPLDVIKNANNNPVLRTLAWLLIVIDCLMLECQPAKENFVDNNLTVSLNRLWPWCMMTDQLRTAVMHLIYTFTNDCPKACALDVMLHVTTHAESLRSNLERSGSEFADLNAPKLLNGFMYLMCPRMVLDLPATFCPFMLGFITKRKMSILCKFVDVAVISLGRDVRVCGHAHAGGGGVCAVRARGGAVHTFTLARAAAAVSARAAPPRAAPPLQDYTAQGIISLCSPSRSPALLLLCLHALRRLVPHHHCKTILLKSEVISGMYRLLIRARVRGAGAAAAGWARLMERAARHAEGGAALLALPPASAPLCALPGAARAKLMPALAHAAHHHRNTFLQSAELLELIAGTLLAGDMAEVVSAARAVWALAANNHKAKLVLRSAGVASAVHTTLQRLQRSQKDLATQQALQLLTYTNTVLQTT
ncbi:hypothetical protein B5X24_HaOG205051 [Helicoverpa armigera]|nr:hypothetical protein B5X24_HaOG205051 [Helicoverpa armigera]